MSNKKTKNIEFKHGGPRLGAGHPETGITKTKICVSVTKQIWKSAQSRWNGKASHLVDQLLIRFVGNKVNPPPNLDMRIPVENSPKIEPGVMRFSGGAERRQKH